MFIVSGCGGGDDAADERVNNPPVAVNDASTVVKGSTTNLDLAVNDSDADDGLDLASITIISAPSNGSVIVNANGSIEYSHDNSNISADTFTYSIKDKSGAVSNTATVTLTINELPVAVNDVSTVLEGMAKVIDLADNDTDVDGLDLGSISVVTPPANGTVVANADGTVNYIHDGSETVSDVFTYSIKDTRGSASNTAAVNIAVTPVNDQPLAVNDVSTLGEGMAATINLAANDFDAEGGLDPASITIVTRPANGSVFNNADGSVEYTHDGSETVSDVFTYFIKDVSGASSNTAAVNITVTPVNDLPIAVNDASDVVEGMSVTIDLADNDTDVDDGLDLDSIAVVAPPVNGSVVANADGTVDYSHDGSETVSDMFTYSIKDVSGETSNTAAVNIAVTPVNDPPLAVNDASDVVEGMSVMIDLADNDTDSDNELDLGSIVIVAQPANGSVVVNVDGTVDYSHDGSETVSDVFTYSIKDVSGASSNTAAVNITVTPVNDPPVAVNDASDVVKGGTVIVDLAGNDIDVDDGLDLDSIAVVTPPDNGLVVVNANGTVDYSHDGTATLSDSFTYTIKDNSGAVSDPATVTLTIELVSISGTIFDLGNTGEQDVDVEGVYTNPGDLQNPVTTTDADGVFSMQVFKDDAVYLHASKTSFATINTARTSLNADVTGIERFMPTEAEAQAVIDTAFDAPLLVNHAWLMVDVEDANGNEVSGHTVSSIPAPVAEVYTDCDGADSGGDATTGPCEPDRQGTMYIAYFDSTAETSVTVDTETQTAPVRMGEITFLEFEVAAAPVNEPPVAEDDALSADHGITTNLDLADNDSDADDGLDLASIIIGTGPDHGTVDNKFDGTVDYTHDGAATLSDTFTYTIKDNSGAVSNTATVTITINNPPVAVNDAFDVDQGSTTNLDLADNDTDANGALDLDLAAITIIDTPAHGTIDNKLNGTVDYIHDGSTTTFDTFTYTIKDNSGAESNTATVTITVITAGLVKYRDACASCHKAGSYDSNGSASDLYNDGEKLITDLSSIRGMRSVPDITQQEVLDLTTFLEDPSIAP